MVQCHYSESYFNFAETKSEKTHEAEIPLRKMFFRRSQNPTRQNPTSHNVFVVEFLMWDSTKIHSAKWDFCLVGFPAMSDSAKWDFRFMAFF